MSGTDSGDRTMITSLDDLQAATTGEPFGPYLLKRELGRGGMGVVYHAYHEKLQRDCAIKLLLQQNQTVSERFVLEGQATARLGKHPNIVQVFDAGVVHGKPYIAMERVSGEPLDEVLKRRGAIPPDELCEIGRRTALGLGHAHQCGIVHRDMKPGNVMIEQGGEPLILDFGLAKDMGVTDSALSVEGGVLGTPSYMPPEQADATRGDVDQRSDVYSLGATLYHALSGRMPFTGERVIDIIVQVLSRDPPRLSGKASGISRDIEAVIFKAMEKDRRHRYQTALEMADDLARITHGEPPKARSVGPVGRIWRKLARNPAVLALLSLVLLVGVGGTAFVMVQRAEADALWRANYDQIARATANETRELLEPAFPLLQECHGLARFGLLPVDDPEQLADHLAVRLQYRKDLSWLSYGDAQGAFTGANRRADDGAIIVNRSWLDDKGGSFLHEEQFLEHGERVTLRKADDWGYDPRKRPWYQVAATHDDPVWLDPYEWYDDEGYGITLTVALRRGRELRGAFTADFRLRTLSEFLAGLDLGEGGRAFLLTPQHTVIARSDLARNETPHPILTRALEHEDFVSAKLAPSEAVSVELDVGGTTYVAAFEAFRVQGGIQWVTAVVVPAATIRGTADSTATVFLAVGGGLVLVLLAGALVLALRKRARLRRQKRRYKR